MEVEFILIINESVKSLSNEKLKECFGADPATIGHMIQFAFPSVEYRASFSGRKAIGRAVTAKIPSMDGVMCHKVTEFVGPGDILLIDRCGDNNYACLGGMVAYALKVRGVEAVIVDGAVTDIQEIRDMDLLVFYRRLSAITTRLHGTDGEINTTINCGGVIVNPGDIILADENGFVVIPPESAEKICKDAIERQNAEPGKQAQLREGKSLADISKANELIRVRMSAK